uniref:Pectinesterase inhibitor domain-containing protein n=1 Tax=Quercus lobata TaxID=97700 RepID=A0A7N2KS84_QUELO
MVSPIRCLSILVIPLLVTSLFYQVSNAVNDTYLDSICHKSTDYELCSSTFAADNRTSTADLNVLLIISISSNMNLLETTIVNRIPKILEILEDPQDKALLQNCQTHFTNALGKLSGAYVASISKNYTKATNLAMDAALINAECDNEYNTTKRRSPIPDVPGKVGRLVFISFVIIDEII